MEHLRQTCDDLGLVGLFLHGSRASGHSRPDSDYDVAFLTRHGADAEAVEGRLLPVLAHHFQCDEREVDLQNLRTSPPHFRVRVLHYGNLLYTSPGPFERLFANASETVALPPDRYFIEDSLSALEDNLGFLLEIASRSKAEFVASRESCYSSAYAL